MTEDNLDDADEIDAENFVAEDDETDADDSFADEDEDDQVRMRGNAREDDDASPARRTFCVVDYTSNRSFMSWYVGRYPNRPTITEELVRKWHRDLVKQEESRTAENKYIGQRVGRPRFKAWFAEHYPEIDWFTAISDNLFTREIIDAFDEFIGQPAIDDFCKIAFDTNIKDLEWPYEFRRWANEKYGVSGPLDVTGEIIDAWREYYDARIRAHDAKCEIDVCNMDGVEWDAGADQWEREGHLDYVFIPNTKVEWAALLQRGVDRIAHEKAEAERKAAKEKAGAAERQGRRTRIEKLKEYKFPAIGGSVPNLVAIGDVRENHDKAKTQLLETWLERFKNLPPSAQTAWEACHDEVDVFRYVNDVVYLTPRGGVKIDGEDDVDDVVAGLRDPAFEKFRKFNEGVRQAIKTLDDDLERLLNPPPDAYVPHRGSTLDEIEDEDERYVLANVIPEGLAVMYGAPKAGKSSWAQKLSACVSSAVPFDGAEVAQGRVLYISCDPGARKGAVKRRMMEILARLELPTNRSVIVVEDPVILNDPASIASLLERNPGKYTLVVIDPLYQCVTGSLLQDAVMMEAIKGLGTISRATGAAILLIHHEPRGSAHLFGSMLLDAALDAQIHVERAKDIVTVKVELLKNGEPPKRPFVYQIEGAYLAPTTAAPRAKPTATAEQPSADDTRYSQMLALLPDTPIRETEARKLVEDLLRGENSDTRRQQWHRALEAMAKASQVTRRGGMVQRRPHNKP